MGHPNIPDPTKNSKLVGGFNQPIWKRCERQLGFIFPNFRGENNKIFELPPPRIRNTLDCLERSSTAKKNNYITPFPCFHVHCCTSKLILSKFFDSSDGTRGWTPTNQLTCKNSNLAVSVGFFLGLHTFQHLQVGEEIGKKNVGGRTKIPRKFSTKMLLFFFFLFIFVVFLAGVKKKRMYQLIMDHGG